jgi:hypothetical protein
MAARLGVRTAAEEHLEAALSALRLMGDEAGIAEVRQRLDRLASGEEELAELSPALNWVRSHVLLSEGKVYCEFEFPAALNSSVRM